jgi:hypothetical protein
MFSEHSRRRTGATDLVAPWAATQQAFARFASLLRTIHGAHNLAPGKIVR